MDIRKKYRTQPTNYKWFYVLIKHIKYGSTAPKSSHEQKKVVGVHILSLYIQIFIIFQEEGFGESTCVTIKKQPWKL